MPDWDDKRPISELTFGADTPAGAARNSTVLLVRSVLDACGAKVAEDIVGLGCTGLIKNGISIDAAREVRFGLAGCGVGLPCYVGPDRYCLVHQTIGGLQDGQLALHPEFVDQVSRELTPEEKGHMVLVQTVRRTRGSTNVDRELAAADALAGHELPKGFEIVEDEKPSGAAVVAAIAEDIRRECAETSRTETQWKCVEHDEVRYDCRFCLAQLVANGALQPRLAAMVEPSSTSADGILHDYEPELIKPERVEVFMKQGVSGYGDVGSLWVEAARWSHKLVRE